MNILGLISQLIGIKTLRLTVKILLNEQNNKGSKEQHIEETHV